MKINLEFIKNRREEKNITLIEMSNFLGFKNASTYLRYENGDYVFKAEMLPILAEKLDCVMEDFFYTVDC
ncbi:MAG: helix-turn-helix domain-containing protein [Peptoanaerobacter stomatis]|uniref:helix-turn-helix domain-containing protein n=1 Tax=Peptoanaerobacter stomatis TaxID=796937 RepID=UPI003FA1406D